MTDPDGMRKFGIRPFSSGMFACPCKAPCPSTVLGSPMNVLTSGVPKPSLKPQSTQTIRTSPKVVNTISTVFIAHFFWTRPPYRTARAGIDISPTSVAAVICQELSPALSQLGYGFTMPPGGHGAAHRPGRATGRATGTAAARNPRQHRQSGSCHVHVTVVVLTLEIICPIVVVCWHTGLVSAYRRAPRPGRTGVGPGRSQDRTGCRDERHHYSGRSGKRLPHRPGD